MSIVPHLDAALAPVPVFTIGQAIEIVLNRPECGLPSGLVIRGKFTNQPVPGSVMGVILDGGVVAVGYAIRKNKNLYLRQFGRPLLPIPPDCPLIIFQ